MDMHAAWAACAAAVTLEKAKMLVPERRSEPSKKLRAQLWKTELCRFHPRCRNGDECPFAHSLMELHQRPDLIKTSLCPAWLNGSCPLHTGNCRYAHGRHELRPAPTSTGEVLCKVASPSKAASTPDGAAKLGSRRRRRGRAGDAAKAADGRGSSSSDDESTEPQPAPASATKPSSRAARASSAPASSRCAAKAQGFGQGSPTSAALQAKLAACAALPTSWRLCVVVGIPSAAQMPVMQVMPAMPQMQAGVPMVQMPQLPQLPQLPQMPQMPQMAPMPAPGVWPSSPAMQEVAGQVSAAELMAAMPEHYED